MKHTFTKETSLFFIDEGQIAEFTSLFENACSFIPFEKGLLHKYDIEHHCLNIWLLLQPNAENMMESMEKTMYYTSDFLILDAFKKNKRFQTLQRKNKGDSVLLSQLAFCLANQLNKWLLEKMGSLRHSTLFNRTISDYYLLFQNDELWKDRYFLDEVSIYTKKVTLALADNRRFEQIFYDAIEQFELISMYSLQQDKAL